LSGEKGKTKSVIFVDKCHHSDGAFTLQLKKNQWPFNIAQ
jgi:hypothetical protein